MTAPTGGRVLCSVAIIPQFYHENQGSTKYGPLCSTTTSLPAKQAEATQCTTKALGREKVQRSSRISALIMLDLVESYTAIRQKRAAGPQDTPPTEDLLYCQNQGRVLDDGGLFCYNTVRVDCC
jgi:hypothetical protein